MHSNQGLLEGVEGGRVQHLLLDLGTVRAPGHQEELLLLARLGGALTLVLVLVVVEAIPGQVGVSCKPCGKKLSCGKKLPFGKKRKQTCTLRHLPSVGR